MREKKIFFGFFVSLGVLDQHRPPPPVTPLHHDGLEADPAPCAPRPVIWTLFAYFGIRPNE